MGSISKSNSSTKGSVLGLALARGPGYGLVESWNSRTVSSHAARSSKGIGFCFWHWPHVSRAQSCKEKCRKDMSKGGPKCVSGTPHWTQMRKEIVLWLATHSQQTETKIKVNGLLIPGRYVEQVTSPDILPPDFKDPYLYVPTHLCSQALCSQLLFPITLMYPHLYIFWRYVAL